jgi:hypothetical protein
MSLRRLLLTTVGMGLVAVALAELSPTVADMAGALSSPQRTADTVGPDTLVIAGTGLLAWAVWAWGVLGLALTAASRSRARWVAPPGWPPTSSSRPAPDAAPPCSWASDSA